MGRYKLYLIFIAVLFVVLLSGCIQVDIETGIDADFTTFLTYDITMDVSEFDAIYQGQLKSALANLGLHYQEHLDFNVAVNYDEHLYSLIMTRRIRNSSYEEAYGSLKNLLSDEAMTPFMQVDFAYDSSVRQMSFLLGAKTDIPHIMQLSNADELPSYLQQKLAGAIEAGTGNITVTLPASETVSSSHPVDVAANQATMSLPMSFKEQTSFELITRLNFLRDGSIGGTLDEITAEQNRLRTIAVYACAAALGIIFIAILLIVVITLKNKKHKQL